MDDGIDESEGEELKTTEEESKSERLALVSEHQLRRRYSIRPSDQEFGSEKVKELSQALVHHYLRRMEFRGSDVRLDVGLFYRPDAAPRTSVDPGRWSWTVAHSYPFRTAEHMCWSFVLFSTRWSGEHEPASFTAADFSTFRILKFAWES